jgi:hypothetical protein
MTPEWTPSGASGERRLRHILSLLAAAPAPSSGQLCAVAARVVDVAGAGVTLEDRLNRTLLCASDAIAAEVEELSFTLGEGPGIDAHRVGSPVSEPDLARPRRARWPSFTPLAVDAGAAAIFAFPLRVGGIRLGALTLYQARSGRLTDGQHADALADQAGAPPGDLAGELDALSSTRADVHQASGMVSVQLGASVADALVRLRAHAYAEGRALSDVAGDVIAGRLRLSE